MVESLNILISPAPGAFSATWDQQAPVTGTLVEKSDSKPSLTAKNPVAVTRVYPARFVERCVASGWGSGTSAGCRVKSTV